jgi:Rrf2 family protein
VSNTHFALGVHTLCLLALQDRMLSSQEIANSVNTHPAFVRRIIGELSQADLVETVLGVAGGVRLNQPSEAITLKAVYQATTKMPLLEFHNSPPNSSCICGGNIQPVLSDVFQHTEQAFLETLQNFTIADLVHGIKQRMQPQML